MKKRKLTIDRNMDHDVVLCSTRNYLTSRRMTELLTGRDIPFFRTRKRLPFFERLGADTDLIYIFSVNRNEYTHARRAIDTLDTPFRKRLTINAI